MLRQLGLEPPTAIMRLAARAARAATGRSWRPPGKVTASLG
jgi:hypothetical protein